MALSTSNHYRQMRFFSEFRCIICGNVHGICFGVDFMEQINKIFNIKKLCTFPDFLLPLLLAIIPRFVFTWISAFKRVVWLVFFETFCYLNYRNWTQFEHEYNKNILFFFNMNRINLISSDDVHSIVTSAIDVISQQQNVFGTERIHTHRNVKWLALLVIYSIAWRCFTCHS